LKSNIGFRAPCGFIYRYKYGVPDFRVKLTIGAQKWIAAQHAFESWIDAYFNKGEADPMFYKREQERDRPIYEVMKLSGRVLDIGGQLGHVRKYMELHQEYCSIDPFIEVHVLARGRKNLFASYPLSSPLNLVGGFAEFLPFKDACFNTINMRSCLDHFFSPEIALLEAYRVLEKEGKLIVGITVQGHSFKSKAKEAVRPIVSFICRRYKDQHIWHPSYERLIDLCNFCGFELNEEIWQADDVLYASFVRRDECAVTIDY
jgi:SAM-dependent methyltransferase